LVREYRARCVPPMCGEQLLGRGMQLRAGCARDVVAQRSAAASAEGDVVGFAEPIEREVPVSDRALAEAAYARPLWRTARVDLPAGAKVRGDLCDARKAARPFLSGRFGELNERVTGPGGEAPPTAVVDQRQRDPRIELYRLNLHRTLLHVPHAHYFR